MHWLYFGLALLCFGLTMVPKMPFAAGVLLVLLALGFILAWMLSWANARIGTASRDDSTLISPEELRRLREQAEARRGQQADDAVDAPQVPRSPYEDASRQD